MLKRGKAFLAHSHCLQAATGRVPITQGLYTQAFPPASGSALQNPDPRIRSRILDRRLCRIYAITVPPYRGG
jgi:hypothetical protein